MLFFFLRFSFLFPFAGKENIQSANLTKVQDLHRYLEEKKSGKRNTTKSFTWMSRDTKDTRDTRDIFVDHSWITPLHLLWLLKPSPLTDDELDALRPDSDDDDSEEHDPEHVEESSN